jgi:DNA-binding NarL/FixJ family response regulator
LGLNAPHPILNSPQLLARASLKKLFVSLNAKFLGRENAIAFRTSPPVRTSRRWRAVKSRTGRCPTMQTATRKSLQPPTTTSREVFSDNAQRQLRPGDASQSSVEEKHSNDDRRANVRSHMSGNSDRKIWPVGANVGVETRVRVLIASDNRLLREALSKTLRHIADIEIVGLDLLTPFDPETLSQEAADILLLSSKGTLSEDLQMIRKVRIAAPEVKILLMGMSGDDMEFLQCVRSGVHGYLLRDASAEEVLDGVRALSAGEVVCPGTLCGLLFRYFEREACSLPSASVHQRLGLTRREQQLVPLIAEGRTNKEIANHFCLSEQTVKNHLYRMKHKVGAGDRLGIVQVCRTQGFLV